MDVAASLGGLLLYDAFGASLTQFTWFDRTGKPLGVVGEPVEHFGYFRLSRDAQRIAEGRAPRNIWLLEAERGLSSPFTGGEALTLNPLWSPDSRTILFSRIIPPGLFRKEASGLGEEHLVTHRPNNTSPTSLTDWSGDGQWVLITEGTPETKFDIWVLPMTPGGNLREGATPKPYLRTSSNGRFSPEPSPRWVAFQSDESGRNEVYIDAFPQPRGKKQISTAGGVHPQWGAGGRELFYVTPDNKLMAVSLKLTADSVEPSVPRELFRLPPPVARLGSLYEATRDG